MIFKEFSFLITFIDPFINPKDGIREYHDAVLVVERVADKILPIGPCSYHNNQSVTHGWRGQTG